VVGSGFGPLAWAGARCPARLNGERPASPVRSDRSPNTWMLLCGWPIGSASTTPPEVELSHSCPQARRSSVGRPGRGSVLVRQRGEAQTMPPDLVSARVTTSRRPTKRRAGSATACTRWRLTSDRIGGIARVRVGHGCAGERDGGHRPARRPGRRRMQGPANTSGHHRLHMQRPAATGRRRRRADRRRHARSRPSVCRRTDRRPRLPPVDKRSRERRRHRASA
jgi:hypothetical protein